MILRLFIALILVAASMSSAAEWTHFRAEKTAGLEHGSSRIAWLSTSQNEHTTEIKLSVTTPALTRSKWSEHAFQGTQLKALIGNEPKSVVVASTRVTNRVRMNERGTPVDIDTFTLTFPAARNEWDLSSAKQIQIKLSDGLMLGFDLNKAERFTPFSWHDLEGTIPIGIEMRPQKISAAMFPLTLRSLRIVDGEMELSLSIRNAHRLPVEWRGNLSGSHFRLLTQDGLLIMPTFVSESVQKTVFPTGRLVDSGFTHEGTLRLPLLSEDEAAQFTVMMPSYRPVTLVFDSSARTWKPTSESLKWNEVDAALDRESKFISVRIFLQDTVKLALTGDSTGYADRFSHPLHDEARDFAHTMHRAGVTDLGWNLDPRDEIVNDGTSTKELSLSMTYRLNGLGAENEFGLDAKIRVHRLSNDSWQITQMKYPQHTPFWQCGYTASQRTEHFTVFHRPDTDGERQAPACARDLESAYAALSAEGLRLRGHYAAFAVTRAEDFRKLTSRSPGAYSGVASVRQILRNGQLLNINQAIYINDPRFSFLERLMRRQGRLQTVQHELAHLSFAHASMPWTPAWLEEGLAMHYANQLGREERNDLEQLLTPGLTLKNLSLVPYLGFGTEQSALAMQAQYLLSAAAVRWLIDQFGVEAVIAFHRSFATDYRNEWKRHLKASQDQLAVRRLEITRVLMKKHFALTLEALDATVKSEL